MMAATAVLGVMSISGISSLGKIFTATFMLFFSLLLFSFEAMTIWPYEFLDHMYKRNFGFLYTTKGKAFYEIL